MDNSPAASPAGTTTLQRVRPQIRYVELWKIPRHEQPIERLVSRSTRYTYVEGRQAVSKSQMILAGKNGLLNPCALPTELRQFKNELTHGPVLKQLIGSLEQVEAYHQQSFVAEGKHSNRVPRLIVSWHLTLARLGWCQ
jgi:hypothetical protein